MRDFKALTTHGAVFDALKPYFKEGHVKARVHYGTARYFIERDLQIHKAFDNFCKDYGMTAGESAVLREVIKETSDRFPHMGTESIRILCESCPRDFTVRGAWTSLRAQVQVNAAII